MSASREGATLRRGILDEPKQWAFIEIGDRIGTGNGLPLRRQLSS